MTSVADNKILTRKSSAAPAPMNPRILLVFLAMLVGLAAPAAAWPERPVRLVVPYAPGGPVDLISRLVADRLSARFGQTFVIENKPGANGAIGVQAVMSNPADGYTLLMHASAGITIYQAVTAQPAFDTLRDLTPVSMVSYFDLVLCANPDAPFENVKGFVDYARAHPGKLSYGSAGIGALNHVGTERFKTMNGINIVHVPYRGDAPVAADLINGTIGIAFVSSNVAIPFIKSGKLRALAVPRKTRLPVLPDVPTMAEQGFPDFELRPWAAFFGPKGLSPDIVQSMVAALKDILVQPDLVAQLAGFGMEASSSTPEMLAETVRANTALWKDVAAKAQIFVE